jgi:putative ABC transport system permease protein
MALVPVSYNLRSLLVRRAATLLTVVGIGATVAVLGGVLALEQGFSRLFTESGRDDLVVLLRPGAMSEGESLISRERASILMKSVPEIASDAGGRALASAESYLAVRLRKADGGETNVPIRGVQQTTFDLAGEDLRLVAGRRFRPGTDEVMVGTKLTQRIRDCQLDEVLVLNTTPYRVVGVFDHDGPFASEIWGDLERLSDTLERPGFNRIIARLRPGVTAAEIAERLEDDEQAPAKAMSEREYLAVQTLGLSKILKALGGFLGIVMGIAAVFTATNTMLAAVAARTHEVGILKAVGFRPFPIFLSFLLEALVLGLAGGAAGCLFTLPLEGMETGTMNPQTFTEVAFAFRVTPEVLATAVIFALILGLLGGAWPAWRAARLSPTEALRRQ